MARSLRIAENLGITDPVKDARCTVCHNPLRTLPNSLFTPAALEKRDTGVSCETCHGKAESWLRFHTRLDITHEQRVAAGMREMRDLYGRANVCVACHLNIDSGLVRAGHPEMFLELDGQTATQPPHWVEKDNDPWFGPREWLTGQAADLRELSWKLARTPTDEALRARVKGLLWLLRLTHAGSSALKSVEVTDPKAVRTAADSLAHTAAHQKWSRDSTASLLSAMAQSNTSFRDDRLSSDERRRRAEVLVQAAGRLWQALQANGAPPQPLLDTALNLSTNEARAQQAFDPLRFAAALQQVEVALTLKK